ncbi:hypothetical protein T484DRAFT_1815405 [Baffinella frigidus]|nr:hypothetical protein T484DRAFT_1815405 [Cryptophyta sp. CCMP2293]
MVQVMAVARELQAAGAKANTMAATRLLETAVRLAFNGRAAGVAGVEVLHWAQDAGLAADEVLHWAQDAGLAADEVMVALAMDTCAKATVWGRGSVEDAFTVLDAARKLKRKIKPNEFTYSAMLATCAKAAQRGKAKV